MSIRYRKQRHVYSCGLACVAMIANKPYNTVVKDFEKENEIFWVWNDKEKSWGLTYNTTTKDLYKLLGDYGFKSSQKRVKYKGKKTLPNLSILSAFSRQERLGGRLEEHWHWVVCERNNNDFIVYDPEYGVGTLNNVEPISHYVKIVSQN